MGFNKCYLTIEKVIAASNDDITSLEKLFNCDSIIFDSNYSELMDEIQALVIEKKYTEIKELINNFKF